MSLIEEIKNTKLQPSNYRIRMAIPEFEILNQNEKEEGKNKINVKITTKNCFKLPDIILAHLRSFSPDIEGVQNKNYIIHSSNGKKIPLTSVSFDHLSNWFFYSIFILRDPQNHQYRETEITLRISYEIKTRFNGVFLPYSPEIHMADYELRSLKKLNMMKGIDIINPNTEQKIGELKSQYFAKITIR